MNGAIERVLDSDFFRDDDNHTNENHRRFIHEVVGNLAGNQQDVHGVLLEHTKRDISYEDPDDIQTDTILSINEVRGSSLDIRELLTTSFNGMPIKT